MTGRFVAWRRDTFITSSWLISYAFVTLLYALWLSFGLTVLVSSGELHAKQEQNKSLNCTLNGSAKDSTSPCNGTNPRILNIIWKKICPCHNLTFAEHIVNVQYEAERSISKNETGICAQTLQISCEVKSVSSVFEVAWYFGERGTCIWKVTNLTNDNATMLHEGEYVCRPVNNMSNTHSGTTVVGSSTSPTSNATVGVTFSKPSSPSSSPVIIGLGVLLGVLVVVVLFGAYHHLSFRRRLQCCCKMYCNGFFSVQNDPPPSSPNKRRPSLTSFSKPRHGIIPVGDFALHVKILHTDGDYRFNQEFESLKNVHVKSRAWTNSSRAENQAKNRYGNIVAYDHSRVILSPIENEPESHYINANYVDSFEKGNAYIATQGPMANTINDFWRMVWEQNCTVVVMITNIIEKGRHKCAMYWPSRQAKTEVHGPLRITYLDEEAFAFYTVRRFEVKPVDQNSHYCQDMAEDEVRPMIVSQYHFTGWPDHGAPDTGCEYPALSFILNSATASQDGAGPIIVHCSAGVGRSGAYIAIHSMVKRMHVTGDVNIFEFLSHIRQQRNHLVQEECQYIFVHDAVLHYIESGFKLAIATDDLKDHVQNLRKNLTNHSRLDTEIENLRAIQVKHYNLKQAKRGCNIAKNRSVDYIPADSARVELYPRPREEGSDYINASYLPGFWKSQAFIGTQYPLEDTTDDFWRMVWQENCRSLVMLLSKAELEQDYYHSYLPPSYETGRFGEYEVTVDSVQTRGDIVISELRMACIKDPSEFRNVRHFHFLHWPKDSNPWSGQTILQLICKVDSWEKEVRVFAKPFEVIGPIVVHCNCGIGRTGAYCILHTMYHQIARDRSVSIFQMARLYNHLRPHCISDKAQYEFCYDTLVEYIEADCSLHLV